MKRREFISSMGVTAGAFALPRFSIAQAGAPTKKLNVAVVGVAGMGGYATRQAATENMVALCDVDDAKAQGVYAKHPDVPKFKDFRVMLDKMGKDIDAVAISTPDHIHFPAAMAAMECGKHVFVQKPLAHDIWQCRALAKAAKHYKVITQMGNQGHTFPGMRRIKEWVDAGVVGDVREVITWTNRPNAPWFIPPQTFPLPQEAVPSTLDWDLWQGPAAECPYSSEYVPVKWRGWWKYGCGPLGDIGCHTFDAPFWSLGLGAPTKIEVERKEPPCEGFISMSSLVTYHFPARGEKPPVILKWYEREREVPLPKRWDAEMKLHQEGGMYMEGTKETIYHGDMRPVSPQLTPNARFMEMKSTVLKDIKKLPDVGKGPIEEWFKAIKGEGPMPGSTFEYAGPLTEMVLLGALAQRFNKTIEWDAVNMKAKGMPELDPFIRETPRKGWSYGEKLA
jgi:predicted dehydrogenase